MKKIERWSPPVYDEDGTGKPNTYSKQDIRAIQALALYAQGAVRPWPPGEEPPPPSPAEVKRALDWIIEKAALTYDEPFVAGQPDVVAYLLGRRAVGLAIVKLMKLRPEHFDQKDDHD